jgi:hypothetical protein
VLLVYCVVLALSAIVLLALAVTGFGMESVVDRLIYGVLGAGVGAGAVYLLFFFEGGTVLVAGWLFLVPIFAGIRLVRGFLSRKKDAADRAGYAQGVKSAEEWRAQRRW